MPLTFVAQGPMLIPTVTMKTNLIGWWELSEATGTVRADSSPNALDMNPAGTTTQVSPIVATGNAVEFAAAGNYLNKIDAPAYDFTNGITVAFWFKYPSGVPAVSLDELTEKFTVVPFQFRVLYSAGGPLIWSLTCTDASAPSINMSATISSNTPYFFAGTANNTVMTASINAGVPDTLPLTAGINPTGGSAHQIGSPFFGADAHDLQKYGLWGRALTSAEIAFLYNGGLGRSYSDL